MSEMQFARDSSQQHFLLMNKTDEGDSLACLEDL